MTRDQWQNHRQLYWGWLPSGKLALKPVEIEVTKEKE